MFDRVYVENMLKDIVGVENTKLNESMSLHTSFKVGGPADIMVSPTNEKHIKEILKISGSMKIPLFIMGNGTNLIVRDKGISGIVLKILDNFNSYEVEDNVIKAGAGILLSRISTIALEQGLSGLEFASGIPGTLGGAVAMNAGAYDGEMKDVVVETNCVYKDGKKGILTGKQHQFGYRTSVIQKNEGIILKSTIKLVKKDKHKIKARMTELNKRRRSKQPLTQPCAGSIFKRPEGFFAGRLIEDCGLKGFRIGGAEVSGKHCGFIVNTGNATASDIINLINHVQHVVEDNFGVKLETEVKIIGEE